MAVKLPFSVVKMLLYFFIDVVCRLLFTSYAWRHERDFRNLLFLVRGWPVRGRYEKADCLASPVIAVNASLLDEHLIFLSILEMQGAERYKVGHEHFILPIP